MSIRKANQFRMKPNALSLVHKLCEAIDTPRSLGIAMAIRYGDHNAILSLKGVDPLHYNRPVDFFLDYQASKILAKSVELRTNIDKAAVAKRKFDEAENECFKTNVYLRLVREGKLNHLPHVERVFQRARDKIASILGSLPSYEVLDFSFGPGASLGVRGDTSVYKKVESTLECTYAFSSILPDFLAEFPGWITEDTAFVKLCSGSELTFVPKDASVDRAICIEPLLNGLYQKGFGRYIRDRLQLYGIDIQDQTQNQRLASAADVMSLSTLDLSSASDTISHGLVLDLLPWDWFNALDIARSPSYTYGGMRKSFHKFSSMGNAYTFELETLIFYALACASAEESGTGYSTGYNLSVYGDDIIVPRGAFDVLTDVLRCCGFATNHSKSFREGVFFESCGHDYFKGLDVRPIFLKEKISRLLKGFYAANGLRRIASKLEYLLRGSQDRVYPYDHHGHRALSGILDVYDWYVATIPPELRTYGPEGFGDGHLISDIDEVGPFRHHTFCGWKYKSYAERDKRVKIANSRSGYALYHNREAVSNDSRSRRADKHGGVGGSFWFDGAVSPSDGEAYAVRGRTELVIQQSFCPSGAWNSWRRVVREGAPGGQSNLTA